MSTSLYQKYRPQTFSSLIGQEHIRKTLLNEIQSTAVTHAYVFSGPRGIGKTTTARVLARAVNCQSPQKGEPCNTCDSCVSILKGKALDVVEIDAASHTGVDHVREYIIENARVAPSQLRKKVFIIDEVHMLSTSAFNALLKTLEEPPAHSMFILATTEIHKVPATILSRCERFTFHGIQFTDMKKRLEQLCQSEQITVDEDVLAAIIKRSEGALRDAESLLGQVFALAGEEEEKHITREQAEIVLPPFRVGDMIGLLEELIQNNTSAAITRVHRLYDEGLQLSQFSKDYIDFLRNVLLFTIQHNSTFLDTLGVSDEEKNRITECVQKLSLNRLHQMLEVFMKSIEEARNATIPQLPLEMAIVELTSAPEAKAEVEQSSKKNTSPADASVRPVSSVDTEQKIVKTDVDAPSVTTVSTDTPAATPNTNSFTMQDVQNKWTQILTEIQEHNHALHVTLQVGQLVEVQGNTLTLGFQYQFYQDRIFDARNRPIMEMVFKQVLGCPVIIQVVIGKEYGPQKSDITNIEQPSDEEVANIWDLASGAFEPESQAPTSS